MALKRCLLGLLIGRGNTAGIGCAIDPPDHPDPALSKDQVKGVLKCQESIKKQGLKFLKKKVKNLEQCADDVLEIQLQLESHIITQEQFNEALAGARSSCVRWFSQVTEASTKLVDEIAKACEPVEDIVLGGDDPLLFQ